jgi:ABC-type dipeptide/oligopeptide/nickel transport system permease subunit
MVRSGFSSNETIPEFIQDIKEASMEWYWWVLIVVVVIAGLIAKFKILSKWMENRAKREDQFLEDE